MLKHTIPFTVQISFRVNLLTSCCLVFPQNRRTPLNTYIPFQGINDVNTKNNPRGAAVNTWDCWIDRTSSHCLSSRHGSADIVQKSVWQHDCKKKRIQWRKFCPDKLGKEAGGRSWLSLSIKPPAAITCRGSATTMLVCRWELMARTARLTSFFNSRKICTTRRHGYFCTTVRNYHRNDMLSRV